MGRPTYTYKPTAPKPIIQKPTLIKPTISYSYPPKPTNISSTSNIQMLKPTTPQYISTSTVKSLAAQNNLVKYTPDTTIYSTRSSAQAAYDLQMAKAAQTKAFLANRSTLANTITVMGLNNVGQKAVVTPPNSSNMNWSTNYTNYANPNHPLTEIEKINQQKGIVLVKSGSGLNLLLPAGANYLNTTANSGLPQTTANSSPLVYNPAYTKPPALTTNPLIAEAPKADNYTIWNSGTVTANPKISDDITFGAATQGNFTMDLSATPVDNSVQTTDLGGDIQHQQTEADLSNLIYPAYAANEDIIEDDKTKNNFFGLSLGTIAIVGVGLTAIFLLRGKKK